MGDDENDQRVDDGFPDVVDEFGDDGCYQVDDRLPNVDDDFGDDGYHQEHEGIVGLGGDEDDQRVDDGLPDVDDEFGDDGECPEQSAAAHGDYERVEHGAAVITRPCHSRSPNDARAVRVSLQQPKTRDHMYEQQVICMNSK